MSAKDMQRASKRALHEAGVDVVPRAWDVLAAYSGCRMHVLLLILSACLSLGLFV